MVAIVVIHLQHATQMRHSSTFSVGVGGGGDFGNYIQAAPRKGRTKHNTAKPVGLCYWFFRDPDTTTHLLFALEHLKNSVAKNTYKIIQIQKVNWVNWHENNQMIYRIESHWGYVYVLVIYFDRAILRFLGLQHGFRQPDFWWEETCERRLLFKLIWKAAFVWVTPYLVQLTFSLEACSWKNGDLVFQRWSFFSILETCMGIDDPYVKKPRWRRNWNAISKMIKDGLAEGMVTRKLCVEVLDLVLTSFQTSFLSGHHE